MTNPQQQYAMFNDDFSSPGTPPKPINPQLKALIDARKISQDSSGRSSPLSGHTITNRNLDRARSRRTNSKSPLNGSNFEN